MLPYRKLGAVGGFIVGFALKKIAKLFIFVLSIFIIALLYLGINGVISVNYDALRNSVGSWFDTAGQASSWLVGLILLVPFIGSFLVSFLLCLKIG